MPHPIRHTNLRHRESRLARAFDYTLRAIVACMFGAMIYLQLTGWTWETF